MVHNLERGIRAHGDGGGNRSGSTDAAGRLVEPLGSATELLTNELKAYQSSNLSLAS